MENVIAEKILSEIGHIKSDISGIKSEIRGMKAVMVTKTDLREAIEESEHRVLTFMKDNLDSLEGRLEVKIEDTEFRIVTFMRDEFATKREVQALRGEFLGK